ncbi:MAG: archaea-specific SMC-related protein [Halanaeroarchaeum sp.]
MTAGPAGSAPVARVSATNVGGIDETAVTLRPGVTVLVGPNATNRTSFLQALIAALGGTDASLKGDADAGEATIEVGEESYTRTLRRRDGTVDFGGDPYASADPVANRFAFLLEDNEARRAVIRGEDLREVVVRPVDRRELEAEIESLRDRRETIDRDLERLDDLAERERDLRAERATLVDRREAVEAELATKREELAALDRPVGESQTAEREVAEALDDRQAARSDLEDLEYRLETERESLAALREERADRQEERETLAADAAERLETVEAELDRLHDHKRSLETTASHLQRVVQFNREMLSGEREDVREALASTPADPTDQLVEDTVVCWTCGSEVDPERVESTLESLQALREETTAERDEVAATIEERTETRERLADEQRRREEIAQRIEEIDREIARREETVADLEERREELTARIEALDERVESLDGGDHDDVLAAHAAVTQREVERDRLADRIEAIDEELADVEEKRSRREELTAERERVTDELAELRTRIERLEERAAEAFNEHMASLLEVLAYDNVERIWIERRETTVREGRHTVERGALDLHVVRATAEGVTYEDTVEHLSESERAVTGLVFALAGYLVHDVHEDLPFLLLDSLEAIDADRIARLVEYFADYADYLVVALLPEDAAALPDAHRVTDI